LKTSDFDYELPTEFIAQHPLEPRDAARLFVLHRKNGQVEHQIFQNLGSFLQPGDLVVLNETRVIPARLYGRKIPTGGRVEILLLRRKVACTWETLVGGKGLTPGKRVQLENGPEGAPLETRDRYQTVYAQEPGSAAAPTAGLHFTKGLIEQLKKCGVNFTSVILHVGLDTFAPVNEDDPWEHQIHTEWCKLTPKAAKLICETKHYGGRVIAVGTTSVRTLETAGREAEAGQILSAFEGPTDLFILPGYQFRIVDAMITNFHLPRSTLVMLVSAFAGREHILNAYETAKLEGYRFYSFGDAMLIL